MSCRSLGIHQITFLLEPPREKLSLNLNTPSETFLKRRTRWAFQKRQPFLPLQKSLEQESLLETVIDVRWMEWLQCRFDSMTNDLWIGNDLKEYRYIDFK